MDTNDSNVWREEDVNGLTFDGRRVCGCVDRNRRVIQFDPDRATDMQREMLIRRWLPVGATLLRDEASTARKERLGDLASTVYDADVEPVIRNEYVRPRTGDTSDPGEWMGSVWESRDLWGEELTPLAKGYYVSLRDNSDVPVAFIRFYAAKNTPEHHARTRLRALQIAVDIAQDFARVNAYGRTEVDDLRWFGRSDSKIETPASLYTMFVTLLGQDVNQGHGEKPCPYCPVRFATMRKAKATKVPPIALATIPDWA